MWIRVIVYICIAVVGAIQSCGEANFFGFNPKRGGDEDAKPIVSTRRPAQAFIHQTRDFPCAKTTDNVGPTTDLLSLTGQLCPEESHSVGVYFIVDWSGSIGPHRRKTDKTWHPGTDPAYMQGGYPLCGRLQALRAIVDNLHQQNMNNFSHFGFIPFAGGVLDRRVISGNDLKHFSDQLNGESICHHVMQDSDSDDLGGIKGQNESFWQRQGSSADTNYRAAISYLEEMLTQQGKDLDRKIVYFISDGEPTVGGLIDEVFGSLAPAKYSALRAANKLRQSIPNLTINGIYLGNLGARERRFFDDFIGHQSRVRVAAQASDLATAILDFPEPVLLSEGAIFHYNGNDTVQKIPISVMPMSAKNTWRFESPRFPVAKPHYGPTGGPLIRMEIRVPTQSKSFYRRDIYLRPSNSELTHLGS